MVSLASSCDPRALVPGSVEAVRQAADRLSRRAASCHDAASQLGSIDIRDAWQGAAGDRFHSALGMLPKDLRRAGDAHARAATALTRYADALEDAQARAGGAVELWNTGQAQTAAAKTRYENDVCVAQANARSLSTGRVTVAPMAGAFLDPGAATRARAEEVLANARSDVQAAGDAAARTVDEAGGDAPEGPSLWDKVGGVWSDAWHGGADVGVDLVNGLASMGNAMVHHPDMFFETLVGINMLTLGAGIEGGGIVLDATGVGAAAGVPANVAGAAVMAAGAGITAHAMLRAATEGTGNDHIEPLDKPTRGDGEASHHTHTSDEVKDIVKAETEPGENTRVRVVEDESQLEDLYLQISKGGTDVTPESYDGTMVKLDDGTLVGLRDSSESGGATIDVRPSSGRPIKVHIQ